MIEIKLKWRPETQLFIKTYPKEFKKQLLQGIKNAIMYSEGKAKKSFGQRDKPKIQTGALRRSITSTVTDRYTSIVASLQSNLVYSAIHEYGGTIKAVNGPYLKFQVKGRWATVKQVVIPARPYLEPAITENLDKIADLITSNIQVERV